MSTYDTSNPVPSSAMPDAWDNNLAMDKVINSEETTVVTRTGAQRDTLAGLQQKSSDQRTQQQTDFEAQMTTQADTFDASQTDQANQFEETRQNLIPLSKQYLTLAAAQADIANIPDGSVTYVRSTDGIALADEYINNSGTLTATGRQMPSQASVDAVTDIAKSNTDSESLVDFCDEEGFVAAKLSLNEKGVGFESQQVSMMPELLSNLLISLFKNTDDGFTFQDEDGRLLADFTDGAAKLMGVTVKYDWLTQIVSLLSSDFGIESDEIKLSVDNGSDDIITMKDPDGIVFLRLTSDFKLQTKIKGSDVTTTGLDSVARIGNNALANISGAMRQRYYLTQMPTADINVFIIYGQSFSVGTYSVVPLSTANQFGNLMLGNSPRGMNFADITSETYAPLGGANTLVNLVEVRQNNAGSIDSAGTFGETSLSGWLNFGKFLHNQRLMTDNDAARTFAGACCGIGGRSIAQLSKGASPNLYNHVITALQGIKDAADAAGKTTRLCGVLWMQGENDGSTSYSSYYSALTTMRTNICTDGAAIFGQTLPPHWYNYQLGGMYTSDSNSMGVSRALLDFCDNNPGLVTFVNPVGQLPNPVNSDGNDNHMFANSYRWFGCDAAKASDLVHRGSGKPVFRMREAVYSGDTVNISFSVPVPPIKFTAGYVGNVATTFADKGFTIKDGSGTIYGADLTVQIIADNVVQITASRDLVAPVNIWLGDKTYHSGVHNIADSDDSLSNYTWDIVTGSPSTESIAELNGKPYALQNWCGADIIAAIKED
nr:sialate O-acetylesterase [Pantoea cypripedii]